MVSRREADFSLILEGSVGLGVHGVADSRHNLVTEHLLFIKLVILAKLV